MKPNATRFCLLKEQRGVGAVAARGGRVVGSFLPVRSRRTLVARLRERFPDAVEAPERQVPGAAAMRRWLAGDPSGIEKVPVDLSGAPPFAARVYRALRRVPAGRTVTYKDLARRAGSPGAARAVGRAMATNPLAPFVPCHRVVGTSGALTGYSAPGGVGLKRRLLEMERAAANP